MLSGICRAFFARCLACADDANRFFVILHSSGIDNKEDSADRGETVSYGSELRRRMFNVIVVQPIGIGEDSSRLLKRDSVLLEVSEGFARIPRKHITVYTLITALSQLASVHGELLTPRASRKGEKWSLVVL